MHLLSYLLTKNSKIQIQKTVILPVGFIWLLNVVCLTQREENRLRVFEDRVLKRIFGPKREK
jgi:hypothetical protein